MRYKIFGHILLVIVTFSFTAPFFSPYTYTFCPSNPENGFICYCIYKDKKDKVQDVNNLVYSSGVKKQVSPEKFNILVLSVENLFELIIPAQRPQKLILLQSYYKSISLNAPDKPPKYPNTPVV